MRYYNHHKTDGIFLALAFVGLEIMDTQACKAANITAILGERGAERALEERADQAVRTRGRMRIRAKAWELWRRVETRRNLGLALAIAGWATARDQFWSAAYDYVPTFR